MSAQPVDVLAVFSPYRGAAPLDETSVDDIPMDEQFAYWAALGETGEASEEDFNRLYAAWQTAQLARVQGDAA